MESYIADLGDIIDDIHLLFDEEDPSLVVARAHSDPHVHCLHDQPLQANVIVDTYVKQFQELSLSFEDIVGSLR